MSGVGEREKKQREREREREGREREITSVISSPWSDVDEVFGFVIGEVVRQELLVFGNSWEILLCGRSQNLEDIVELVLHSGSREQWAPAGHLIEDTAHTPEKETSTKHYLLYMNMKPKGHIGHLSTTSLE